MDKFQVATSAVDSSVADTAADSADNTAEASADLATDRHRAATEEDTHRSRDMLDTKVGPFLELERILSFFQEVQVGLTRTEPAATVVLSSSTGAAAAEDEAVLPAEEEAEVVGAPDKASLLTRTFYCHSCDFPT